MRAPLTPAVRVTSGTARLAVDVMGDGPAMVLLHAGVADRRAWDACAPRWAAGGRRVIAYDRRGFGGSTWEAEPHSHVADLLAVMDQLDVDRAVLVGNSMGGATALDTALAHPDRVSGLVLIGAAVSGAPEPDDADLPAAAVELDDAIGVADRRGDVEEVNRLEAWLWLDGPLEREGRVGGETRELFLDMNRIALVAPDVGEERESPPAWDRLPVVAVPTLVVVGQHDLPELRTRSRQVVDAVPGAELVELPGTAHLPSLDAPQALVDVVAAHLAG